MRKVINYKDRTFVLTVELDVKAEKRMDGEVWHRVTAIDSSHSFKSEDLVVSQALISFVEHKEDEIRKFIDQLEAPNRRLEVKLGELGFVHE